MEKKIVPLKEIIRIYEEDSSSYFVSHDMCLYSLAKEIQILKDYVADLQMDSIIGGDKK